MAIQEQFMMQAHTQAEKDRYLVDCFHDSGFLKQIVEGDYSILAGRKGTGKTAIARYLEQKHEEYDLLTSKRISITAFTDDRINSGVGSTREKILLFILLQTAKNLYDKNYFAHTSLAYWEAVFKKENLSSVGTFEHFRTASKTNNIGANLGLLRGKLQENLIPADVEISSESVFNSMIESLDEIGALTSHLVFVDDISDYLDDSDKKKLEDDIEVIKDVLLRLDAYNTHALGHERGIRFVTCVRDDLFGFMNGSNINKLRTGSLFLSWNEASFAGLLIRRLPHFANNREEALADPINSIKNLFPDQIFQTRLAAFETNRYGTNFYAYMVAISFNRPRDFLAYCYALRNRLSLKHSVLQENIDAAEIEYSDYFINEIRDELYLAGKILEFDSDSDFVNKLVDILAERADFNSNQLRTNIAPLLSTKTKLGRNKIEQFVYQLWLYGIIGYKEKKQSLIHFRYIAATYELLPEKLDEYAYYLHRGLWWFTQKRKKNRSSTTT